jgi:hypothetical protein
MTQRESDEIKITLLVLRKQIDDVLARFESEEEKPPRKRRPRKAKLNSVDVLRAKLLAGKLK